MSSNQGHTSITQKIMEGKFLGKVTLNEMLIHPYDFLNPFIPRSDQHVTFPYKIHTLSSKQVMRILKLIR